MLRNVLLYILTLFFLGCSSFTTAVPTLFTPDSAPYKVATSDVHLGDSQRNVLKYYQIPTTITFENGNEIWGYKNYLIRNTFNDDIIEEYVSFSIVFSDETVVDIYENHFPQ